jgi:lysophospholipase L1-like esterase
LKIFLTRLALVAFGLTATLLLLELGVRLWFSTAGSERDRILYLEDRASITARTAQLTGVPYLNYSLNPAWEDINARGYRGALAAVPKPEGVYRIVAIGGSTTYGHGLTTPESWPYQLQQILREDYGLVQVEVVNLGAPGYYSLDSVVNLATRGLAHQPDLVIAYDGVNDAVIRMYQDPACYNGDTPLFAMGMDRGIWQFQAAELPPSALYRFIGYRLGWLEDPTVFTAALRHTGLCPPEPGGISQVDVLAQNPPTHFARNERSLAALAQSGGARMLFSTFAWDIAAAQAILTADPEQGYIRALQSAIDEQNALIRQIAAETGSLLVDLAAEMGDGPYFQGDQVHQSAAGASRQAEIYAAAVAGLLEAGGG